MISIKPVSDLNNYKDVLKEVVEDLRRSIDRANEEGWISDEEMRKVMGI